MPEASYLPGDLVAVAGANTWCLFGIGPRVPFVATCWTAVRDGATVVDVLMLVLDAGFAAVPAFALVGLDAGGGRAILRGGLQAECWAIDANAAPLTIDGAAAPTWLDQPLPDHTAAVRLGPAMGPAHEAGFPLSGGVFMASAIELRLTARPASAPPAPMPPAAASAPVSPVAAAPHPVEVATAAEDPPVRSFDHLFGMTGTPMLEDSPVPESPPGDGPVVAVPVNHEPLDTSEPDDPDFRTLPPPHELEVGGAPSGGLIDAVPWGREQPVVPAATLSANGATPVATISRASLAAAATPSGPLVLARACANGHLTPAFGPSCRVCGQALPVQEAFESPRPALGTLRLSTGEQVVLDRNVLMGRQPEVADMSAADRPHLVAVNNPANDISRRHVEVTLDGWNVLLTDLGSMNGTVMTLPGHRPERIRPHDPRQMESGTAVNLADDVFFTFEVDR